MASEVAPTQNHHPEYLRWKADRHEAIPEQFNANNCGQAVMG
jgi:hypothetical protein